jgi:hypothetical protein
VRNVKSLYKALMNGKTGFATFLVKKELRAANLAALGWCGSEWISDG